MTLYIFDFSYKKFFSKNLYVGKPIIFGYIPKLFKNDYLELYRNLKKLIGILKQILLLIKVEIKFLKKIMNFRII